MLKPPNKAVPVVRPTPYSSPRHARDAKSHDPLQTTRPGFSATATVSWVPRGAGASVSPSSQSPASASTPDCARPRPAARAPPPWPATSPPSRPPPSSRRAGTQAQLPPPAPALASAARRARAGRRGTRARARTPARCTCLALAGYRTPARRLAGCRCNLFVWIRY